MTYRLRLDPTLHEVYASLPQHARDELAGCLVDALADPLANSSPYGVDDGVMRTVARGHTTAVILVDHATKSLVVVQINHVG